MDFSSLNSTLPTSSSKALDIVALGNPEDFPHQIHWQIRYYMAFCVKWSYPKGKCIIIQPILKHLKNTPIAL